MLYYYTPLLKKNKWLYLYAYIFVARVHTAVLVYCKCQYIYHYKCIIEWLNINSSCPHCRKKITKTDIRILIICSSTAIRNIVPIGIINIIEKNIGIISLNLHFRAPSKVK